MIKTKLLSAAVVSGVALFATTAFANTYTFDRVTNNAPVDIGSQFTMDVTEIAGGVLFKFFNNLGVPSSITDIYFDDQKVSSQKTTYTLEWKKVNGHWTQVSVPHTTTVWNTVLFKDIKMLNDSGAGVSFDSSASPSNLPGGNTIGFTSDFSGDSNSPNVSGNGVNAPGEWVSYLGKLQTGKTFDDVLASLLDSDFRVGLHVQSIKPASSNSRFGNGEYCDNNKDYSDSYVNNPSPVPLPAAAWLFGSALIGFVSLSNRRKV